jgi:hypothetical protein
LLKLARCSKHQQIILAGPKSPQLMQQLRRRGCERVPTTATCGLPAGQYHAALVVWHGHSINALAATLDWLVHFVRASEVLAVRIATEEFSQRRLDLMLRRLGFRSEASTCCEGGIAISARRQNAATSSAAA